MLYISDVCVSHDYKMKHFPNFCDIDIDDDTKILFNEPEDEILEINISKVGSIKFNFNDHRIKTFIGNCESIEIDNECDKYFNQITLQAKDLYIITIYRILLNMFKFKITKVNADSGESQFITESIIEQVKKDNNKRQNIEDQTDN